MAQYTYFASPNQKYKEKKWLYWSSIIKSVLTEIPVPQQKNRTSDSQEFYSSRGKTHCSRRRIRTAKAQSLEEEVRGGGKSNEKRKTIKEKEQKKNKKKRGKKRKRRPSLPIAPPIMGNIPCTVKSCSPFNKPQDSNLCFCTHHQSNFTHGTHTLQCSHKGKLPGWLRNAAKTFIF
jgi:hypothetical protein